MHSKGCVYRLKENFFKVGKIKIKSVSINKAVVLMRPEDRLLIKKSSLGG